MRSIYLAILFLVSTVALAQEGDATFKLNIESFLLIKGSSNVNKFECKIDGSNINDTITVKYQANGSDLNFHQFRIDLEVDHFDCQNSMITSDFKESLKADDYPHMIIEFIQLKFPHSDDPFKNIFPTGIIAMVTLTDKHKKYYIGLEKESLEGPDVKLTGNLAVDMRDFGLEPPTKMLSLVKVNPLLDIKFSLSMSRI